VPPYASLNFPLFLIEMIYQAIKCKNPLEIEQGHDRCEVEMHARLLSTSGFGVVLLDDYL